MKKILNCFILLVATGIVFTSCSNLSKISVAKRHYRGGYYVNFGRRNHSDSPIVTQKLPGGSKHLNAVVLPTNSENTTVQFVPASEFQKQVITKKKITQRTNPEIFHPKFEVSSATHTIIAQNTYFNEDVSGSSGDGNHDRNVSVPFVIIVLCAIFIPPLGVGLMYGIDSYFWIDLILTLLFFIPGMIFALVVVLM